MGAFTGALYYQEYKAIHPVAFPFGLMLVCGGILLLLKKAHREPTPSGGQGASGNGSEAAGNQQSATVRYTTALIDEDGNSVAGGLEMDEFSSDHDLPPLTVSGHGEDD